MNTSILSRALRLIPFSLRNRIKTMPGIAQLQRAILARTLDGREFEHRVDAGPAKGISFSIHFPEDKGIWTGAYEIHFATQLAAAVKPDAVTYDIGSWHGFFAGVMAANGAGHVHVFEPLPENAERVRRLIVLNPKKTITLHACAVGERDAEMDLIVMPDTSMAKLQTSTFRPAETSAECVRVRVRSIDAMVAAQEIAPPGLIKIDVEGAEMMVLTGARDTLRRHRPIIFAEIHSSSLLSQCRSLLESEGYWVKPIDHEPANALAKDVFHIMATPGQPA